MNKRLLLDGRPRETKKDCAMQGFLYLAQLVAPDGALGLLKIGYSTNPPERAAHLTAQMEAGGMQPPRLRLLYVFAGTRRDERALHSALRRRYEDYNGFIGAGQNNSTGWYTGAPEVSKAFLALAESKGGLVDWEDLRFPVEVKA